MKVLHVFDTKAEAARALGVSGEAVRKWCVDGVPAERVIAVCEAANWKVTPHMLRPDIYPNPDDALPTGVEAVECASGEPRRGPDRRHPDRRKTNRRKEGS